MWPFISSIVTSILSGGMQPLKDYIAYKSDQQAKIQEFNLAQLNAQIETIKSNNDADTNQLNSRLNATSQSFKQTTFWLLCVPVLFSVTFPKNAAVMWANFDLMPPMFQWLFMSVYSSIWGLPIVKGGYGAITDLMASRRAFKLEKLEINRKAVFDELRVDLFKQGMTQQQVDNINKALDKGEA